MCLDSWPDRRTENIIKLSTAVAEVEPPVRRAVLAALQKWS
jgi:hypothetical protein